MRLSHLSLTTNKKSNTANAPLGCICDAGELGAVGRAEMFVGTIDVITELKLELETFDEEAVAQDTFWVLGGADIGDVPWQTQQRAREDSALSMLIRGNLFLKLD